jgi:VIT1/CCC1 family predicted Fe2+/Mn2+ transporter
VAHEIVDILSQNKEGFLKVMMIEELHLIPDEENPIRNSIVTFFSFCIFGIMPLIPFFVAQANNIQLTDVFTGTTIGIAAFFLFVLGFGKSFVTSQKWYFSTLETILIGAISAGAAFGIGKAFGE